MLVISKQQSANAKATPPKHWDTTLVILAKYGMSRWVENGVETRETRVNGGYTGKDEAIVCVKGFIGKEHCGLLVDCRDAVAFGQHVSMQLTTLPSKAAAPKFWGPLYGKA